jgi:hypothetical protein
MLYPKKYSDGQVRVKKLWEVRSDRYSQTPREVLVQWFSSNDYSRKYLEEISKGRLTKSVYTAVEYLKTRCRSSLICFNVGSVREKLEVIIREYQCARDWACRYYTAKKKWPARSELHK